MGPSSRPGPVLGHFMFKKVFFFSTIGKEGEFVSENLFVHGSSKFVVSD